MKDKELTIIVKEHSNTLKEHSKLFYNIVEMHKEHMHEILDILTTITNMLNDFPNVREDTKETKKFRNRYEETLQSLKDTIDKKMKKVDENNRGFE